eukprot:CAMPEP_0206253340 /NCGR_PEP_ID=MMETSP0047_2-20121206/23099_1 /ASSEMBLY_ACC=CAM_ASM_000192 /TAXON_ID=195065 /ORGANISM="Chroomonas mesostigmatica_cf, Strain CCMP1168" /LENGTH=257 /DNA_ID=CAMNT_0053679541 /DNA_START=107 /DNA_END=877 /DNA_ORIENTATION=-
MPCFVCVDTSERAIIQVCGKYSYTAGPGLNFICWPVQTAKNINMKVEQVDVRTETKTKDNVSIRVTSAVQYAVDPERVDDYYFRLDQPQRQISAHVEDSVRSFMPTMELDQAFESKEEMAEAIKQHVAGSMGQFGIIVSRCLVTDMQPDSAVLQAMNQINSAKRLREAALEKAEAEKIMTVRSAEADAESKHLSGVGVSRMRQAITDGFKGSIENMQESTGMAPREVVNMMLVTQYLDVLKEFAQSGQAAMIVPAQG